MGKQGGSAVNAGVRRIMVLGAVVLATILCLYLASYVSMSVNGRYEPMTIGLNGVKSYGWAPNGFVADYRWNRTLMLIYFPLHCLDVKYWHPCDEASTGKYPTAEVSREEIGKIYRAWE